MRTRRRFSQDQEGTPWTVLSDVAIAMVLVLVVYLVLQFLVTFREQYINGQLVLRQQEVQRMIYAEVDRNTVRIDSIAPDRQKLTFQSELLFPECGASLTRQGDSLLARVGRVLGSVEQYFEEVRVEGHADAQPIGGCDFESNWELSSRRATSVVHFFVSMDLIANRKLSAIGRAEFQPSDPLNFDPSDPLNFKRNRRIELGLLYSRGDIEEAMKRETNGSGS